MSPEERAVHYDRWEKKRKPMIEQAELARKRNGLDIIRCDEDLHQRLRDEQPLGAAGLQNMVITADNTLIPTSSSTTADDDDSGYDGNYDYDSDTSQSPPRRRKCLVCHKRVWNDDYDGPVAAAVKKPSCTWNYQEAPHIQRQRRRLHQDAIQERHHQCPNGWCPNGCGGIGADILRCMWRRRLRSTIITTTMQISWMSPQSQLRGL